ncbi:hypothetical protein ACN261_16875 [Micromonospora sp. WMMD723]|uniref:hypothetical protein n=1 Tax=Micromonospora sp. WMMD723 TaxID=3403465 RepID=UPI003CE75624
MAERTPGRRNLLLRLGAPGPYVLSAAFATALWFPLRLFEDPDRSVPLALVRAGLAGVVWGLFPFLMAAVSRSRSQDRSLVALRRGVVPAGGPDRAAMVDQLPATRRGALIAVVGGVPLFGGLAALAPTVDRPASGVAFLVVLAVVLTIAGITLGRVRRLDRRLAGISQVSRPPI